MQIEQFDTGLKIKKNIEDNDLGLEFEELQLIYK